MKPESAQRILQAGPNVRWHGPFECGDGWTELLIELFRDLRYFADIRVTCVKEKYGTLRVYASDGPENPKLQKLLSEAETKSRDICERCGKPGMLIRRGFLLTTACPDHYGPTAWTKILEDDEIG